MLLCSCCFLQIQVAAFSQAPTKGDRAIVKGLVRDEVAIELQPLMQQLTQLDKLGADVIKLNDQVDKLDVKLTGQMDNWMSSCPVTHHWLWPSPRLSALAD